MFAVITTDTTSPTFKVVLKVDPPVPTAVVPINHWYVGAAPPLVGVAVNVIKSVEHIVLSKSLLAIVTDGTTGAVTVVVIAFEVAVGVD